MAKKKKASSETKTKKAKTKKAAAAKEGAKKTPKRKAAKRSRKKAAVPDRFRIYWGVFNHALKRVALYEFNQKKAAEKRASELSEGGKPPHFVQKIKEVIDPSTITDSGEEE